MHWQWYPGLLDFPWKTFNHRFLVLLSFNFFKLLYFWPFAENMSSSFYQKHWRHFLNHLCSVFVAIFYVFRLLRYLFQIFLGTNAKPVNFTVFTRRPTDKIATFLRSIRSGFLINFVFKKAIVLFIFLKHEVRWQITVYYCVTAHALVNEIVYYILLILKYSVKQMVK
jgi:hypothetical protein